MGNQRVRCLNPDEVPTYFVSANNSFGTKGGGTAVRDAETTPGWNGGGGGSVSDGDGDGGGGSVPDYAALVTGSVGPSRFLYQDTAGGCCDAVMVRGSPKR
jgi:hypothetical protein